MGKALELAGAGGPFTLFPSIAIISGSEEAFFRPLPFRCQRLKRTLDS
ncbi:MAG: hypothetical protein LBE49_04145 [Deltaproteobacteria bacterium]|nr:hypothetical protein [Deltaproteobacteria bacterium]